MGACALLTQLVSKRRNSVGEVGQDDSDGLGGLALDDGASEHAGSSGEEDRGNREETHCSLKREAVVVRTRVLECLRYSRRVEGFIYLDR